MTGVVTTILRAIAGRPRPERVSPTNADIRVIRAPKPRLVRRKGEWLCSATGFAIGIGPNPRVAYWRWHNIEVEIARARRGVVTT